MVTGVEIQIVWDWESELRPIGHGAGQIFLSNNFTEPYPKKSFMYAMFFLQLTRPLLAI